MRPLRLLRFCLVLFFICLPTVSLAASDFVPLANYQDSPQLQDLYKTDTNSFSIAFNSFWAIALSIGAFLAVVKLMQAGFLYQGADYWDKKQKGREIVQDVMLGLVILFGVWLILYQINPCILDLTRLLKDFGTNQDQSCNVVP